MTQNPGQWGPQGGYPPAGPGRLSACRSGRISAAAAQRPASPRSRVPTTRRARTRRRAAVTRRRARPAVTGSSPHPAVTASPVRCRRRVAAIPPAGGPARQEESRPDHRHRGRGRRAARRDRRHHHGAQPGQQRPAASGVDHPDRHRSADRAAHPGPDGPTHRAGRRTAPSPRPRTPPASRRAATRWTWAAGSAWPRPAAGRCRRPARVWPSSRRPERVPRPGDPGGGQHQPRSAL